ncbi:2,3,4,5-tetrahydropyridine-2,6-dicarboxylate N-succinyltransferase [Boudabousia tangfeifanii]|uniref:2,3,4,5-tetrahydropyridine-2,6-dicarboxylate N-succinyltransferase n=1 Tax=Boudabousia tangfeifanii TaxID=1912795 RepID=A0A1D9MJG5_9ACTO|nr:2,3,4,5-tetrahydropyridine-2,6-dicarboxylate N-succinyltransferase [Boudabousia tangfeifanii]AOZ72426.1 2,3,4,5-tetrahydropyridine-2,6-dicarboxylate N-succinyltransferase [Boudabousia tangfeifanii]
MEQQYAYATGLASVTYEGKVLEVWYPEPKLANEAPQTNPDQELADKLATATNEDDARHVRTEVVFTVSNLAEAVTDTADAYLRLQVLSHRLRQPNTINLEGLFGALVNVVWTDAGPCDAETFEEVRWLLRLKNGKFPHVYTVDKFPSLTDYVQPEGVRIADARRVRLGAYLSPGTTVMPAGFVNFNAGTLGTSMVEGRIAQGVVIGDGSDIGGGASMMGTLSGGGKKRVALGKRCLLGAEAGLGIALGDDCVVEAGLYLTAGTKVTVVTEDEEIVVSARDLSGQSNLLFWRNSKTGRVEARPRNGVGIELNAALHAN